MRRLLRSAAAVVMNTREAARRVSRDFPELASRVVTIPNGFDAEDFAGPAPARNGGPFRIVHTGYLYTAAGLQHRRTARLRRLLGGSSAPVDILPRSHVYLVRALASLLATEPGLARELELHLAGVLSAVDLEVAAELPVVRAPGYLPHADAVELIRSADLLFLPLHDVPPGDRVAVVPGKTYEYLASGRPILGAVPDGDARDLLLEAGTAAICAPTDWNAMAQIVRAEVERRANGEPVPEPRPDVLARYERRRLTADLAGIFDRLLGS
jgi:glycosyltransferase involved in cell wall biosynthesis